METDRYGWTRGPGEIVFPEEGKDERSDAYTAGLQMAALDADANSDRI
jgi:hypothetical protein